ncbi:capsular polysaccharide synthesis protein [Lactococcus termiticola]|uniref:Capsular polysaccharide synthesis protein n=2 Tax=Lactococcus termiticola TaxID=2169526 RepID=A0A2R5HGR7_9LACT|nr:capsular polysaccharide synthesis protein [Lactococcus termiticola]
MLGFRELGKKLVRKKDKQIIAKLFSKFNLTISRYNEDFEKEESQGNQIIWFFWWQGIDSAPPIVKKCLESIKHNSNGRTVVIVSKDNLDEYIIKSVREELDRLPVNNENVFSVMEMLEKPYDRSKLDEIINGNSLFFKLTYKLKLDKELDGVETTYSALLDWKF